MSTSPWWKHAFKLNTIDGPVVPPLSPPSRPPRQIPGLREAMEVAHAETIAQSAEENNDFLELHREAFEILARDNWDPWNAWNYLWNLGADSRMNLSHAEVLERAQTAQEPREMANSARMDESDVDAPEGWANVVYRLVQWGYDLDYLQAFAYTISLLEGGMFTPENMFTMLRGADMRRITFGLVPGLGHVYGEQPPVPVAGDETEDDTADDEAGFMELGEDETADEDMEMDTADDEEGSGDDNSLPDYGSPTPEPAPAPSSSAPPSLRNLSLYHGPEPDSTDSDRSHIDDDYAQVLRDLDARIAFLGAEDGTEGYQTPLPVADGPVAAGRRQRHPPPPPPGVGGSEQGENPHSDDSPPLLTLQDWSDDEHNTTIEGPPNEDEHRIDNDEISDGNDDTGGGSLTSDAPENHHVGGPAVPSLTYEQQWADRVFRNDNFVATHKAVFSVLAADSWSPYMAWRFVNFLVSVTGGNATMAELIKMVGAIDQDQLHEEYTHIEEDELVKSFQEDVLIPGTTWRHDGRLPEFVRTLYRAGFDAVYLRMYITELETIGWSVPDMEEDFKERGPHYVRRWLWTWAPSLWEVWNDAEQPPHRAHTPTQPSTTAGQHRSSPARFTSRRAMSSAAAGYATGRWPPTRPGGQPYSPSYPPVVQSSDAPVPDSFEYTSPRVRSPRTPPIPSRTTPGSSRSGSRSLSSPTVSQLGQVFVPASPPPPSLPDTPQSTQPAREQNLPSRSPSSARTLYGQNSPPFRRSYGAPSRSASAGEGRRSSYTSPANGPSPYPIRRVSAPAGTRRYHAGRPPINEPQPSAPPRGARSAGASPPSRLRGILRRVGDCVPLVDPLRYTNRLTAPRRLPDTPTRSHQPPSARRSGPRARPRTCGECGRPYENTSPERAAAGRVAKTPRPVIRKSASPIFRKTASPAVKKAASHTPSPVVKKQADSPTASSASSSGSTIAVVKIPGRKTAGTKGVVKKAAAKKSAAKKTAAKNAVAKTSRRSGRTIRRPDFLGS